MKLRRLSVSLLTLLLAAVSATGQQLAELQRALAETSGTARAEVLADLVELRRTEPVPDAQAHAEEALALLQEAPDGALELRVRLGLSWLLGDQGDSEAARNQAETCRALARGLDDLPGLALAEYHLALAEWRLCRHAQALAAGERALALQNVQDDLSPAAKTLTLLGVIHRSRSAYPEALRCHLEALALAEQLGDPAAVARSRNNIGLIHWVMDEHEKAFRTLEAALDTYRQLGEDDRLGTALSNCGLILIEMGRPADALPLLEEARRLQEARGERRCLAKVLSNLGFAHEELGEVEVALAFLEQSLALREELGDTWGTARALGQIGLLHARAGRAELALPVLQRALVAAREADARSEQSLLHANLAEVHEQLGQYRQALESLRQHQLVEAELDRETAARRIAELEAQAALDAQQRELEALEFASMQQELRLVRQQNTQALLTYGLVALVVAAAGLLLVIWWRSRTLALVSASHRDLQLATERLGDSERRYRTVFEDATLPKILIDQEPHTILEANGPAAALCGVAADQLPGRQLDQACPDWLVQAVARPGDDQAPGPPVEWRDPEGSTRVAEVWTTPLSLGGRDCAVVTVHDVTERRSLELERMRLDKLESLGLLAGGIAHDFNNTLAAIMGFVSIARARVTDEDGADAPLAKAEQAVERAAQLTNRLLAVSHGGEPQRSLHDVGQLVRDAVGFALSGADVHVSFDLASDLWPAELDAGQFEQVLRNLVLNAVQAMADVPRARLTVSARNLPPGTSRHAQAGPGPYLQIQIQDVGPGIPSEIQDKVFDPYFTTRSDRPGLGLTTVYAAVTRHGGWVDVESSGEEGTTVTTSWPASPSPVSDPKLVPRAGSGGSGSILVMDDDPLVQGVFEAGLAELGYRVEVTADGQQAIDRYRAARDAGQPFDLVILDLTVPGGLGGRPTMEALRRLDPDVLGIVTSGYSSEPIMARHEAVGFAAALPKPFTVAGLGQLVRTVLAGRPAGASGPAGRPGSASRSAD